MKDLNLVIGMYFQRVSPHRILCGDVNFHEFAEKEFEVIAMEGLKHMTESETKELYRYLRDSVGKGSGENGLNVFRALKELVANYLIVRDNEPICRYEKMLEWRELVCTMGEDLPICAFLAYRTEKGMPVWNGFAWNTVIGHDNMQLNRMMQSGISDNHFHLFGSAPTFKLIWLKLMNDLNHEYGKALQKIDGQRRKGQVHYSGKYREDTLERMHFQAALIRAFLFSYIHDIQIERGETGKGELDAQSVYSMLTEDVPLWIYRGKVQKYIDALKYMSGFQMPDSGDYANRRMPKGRIETEFWGERELIYHVLCGEIHGRTIPDFIKNWLYLYLTIKIRIRNEFVQVNDKSGFLNFKTYSGRKSAFLSSYEDEKKMVQHAVIGSMEPGNIRSLELRITPCNSVNENRRMIEAYDSYIKEYPLSKEVLCNIYYVFHFGKKQDVLPKEKNGFLLTARHAEYRRNLEWKAEQLIYFREREPESASRVLGIDACSNEIGCRPEVFAPVFRRLTQHVVQGILWDGVVQWKMTYHVGEDWLDFVDGLRAVDEAVLFLNMRNGDRLGHATVLGLDVQKWYEKKYNSILLRVQDYLDNVVWMYHKLIEYDIKDSENLKGMLCGEYEKYFKLVYGDCLKQDYGRYDIDTYYEAWKLRGDHPDLYKTGKYENPYSYFRTHWENRQIVNGEEIRNRKEVTELLYYYHFSANVRHVGSESKFFEVSQLYVEGVEKIQRAMQNRIAELGIGIEANPTSNLLISSMDEYREHPIVRMFNLGLTVDPENIAACPQLHVSINTDDKGVFLTSLENEYALMGSALERAENEHKNKIYRKQMVYQWLDHIRENGNQQSFFARLPEKW